MLQRLPFPFFCTFRFPFFSGSTLEFVRVYRKESSSRHFRLTRFASVDHVEIIASSAQFSSPQTGCVQPRKVRDFPKRRRVAKLTF